MNNHHDFEATFVERHGLSIVAAVAVLFCAAAFYTFGAPFLRLAALLP